MHIAVFISFPAGGSLFAFDCVRKMSPSPEDRREINTGTIISGSSLSVASYRTTGVARHEFVAYKRRPSHNSHHQWCSNGVGKVPGPRVPGKKTKNIFPLQ